MRKIAQVASRHKQVKAREEFVDKFYYINFATADGTHDAL